MGFRWQFSDLDLSPFISSLFILLLFFSPRSHLSSSMPQVSQRLFLLSKLKIVVNNGGLEAIFSCCLNWFHYSRPKHLPEGIVSGWPRQVRVAAPHSSAAVPSRRHTQDWILYYSLHSLILSEKTGKVLEFYGWLWEKE